jgi:hypothetical protein
VVVVVMVAGIVAIAGSAQKQAAAGGRTSGGTVVPAGDLQLGTVDGHGLAQLPSSPTSFDQRDA